MAVRRDQWGRQVRTIHDKSYSGRGVSAGQEYCHECRQDHTLRLAGGATDFGAATAGEIYQLRLEIAPLQRRLAGGAA